MKVVCIIQARMGSTRLPGKVLAPIEGKPLLWYVVHRAKLATCLDQVIVATPDTIEDLAIHAACAEWDIPCIAGPEHDVLSRYAQIAEAVGANVVVRITGDCPFVDPRLIDLVVWRLLERQTFYSSNVYPTRTFPDGLDVEAFTRSALRAADRFAFPEEREHVTPAMQRYVGEYSAFWDIRGDYVPACTTIDPPLGDLRWTVDTAEDLAFVRDIYRALAPRWDFPWEELLDLPIAFRTQEEAARA